MRRGAAGFEPMNHNTGIRIRNAVLADYVHVDALWLELNALHTRLEPELIQRIPRYLSEDQYLAILGDEKQDILVVEDRGVLIAAAWLAERQHDGGQSVTMPVAFIYEICVTEKRRGEGIGSSLMGAIERWSGDRGAVRLEFNVWSANTEALSFYEKLGFRSTRHEMSKSLHK
jgi:GNAT superfamily N-acetyltransferase